MKQGISFFALAIFPTLVNAASLDRSGQQVDVLFEKGNYASLSYGLVTPSLEGVDTEGKQTGNMGSKYGIPSVAVKVDVNDKVSAAFIYDQPWASDVNYPNGESFLSGTKADVGTQNLTALAGFRPAEGFMVYAGPQIQKVKKSSVKASVVREIIGINIPAQYTLNLPEDTSFGYVAGLAYEIPDIALRADVTYRSKVKHEGTATESLTILKDGLIPLAKNEPANSSVSFPQSINLNFQTGVAPKTLLRTKLRWVNWKNFKVAPPVYAKRNDGANLVSYNKDQLSGEIGIGRRLTPEFSGLISYVFDSGTGEPISLLTPYDGYQGVAVGGKYKLAENLDVSGGVRYIKLGDAENVQKFAKFTGNSAFAVGAKLGWYF